MGQVATRVLQTLDSGGGTRIPSLRVQNIELLPATQITDILIRIFNFFEIGALFCAFLSLHPLNSEPFPLDKAHRSIPLSVSLAGHREFVSGFAVVSAQPVCDWSCDRPDLLHSSIYLVYF